MFQSPGGYEGSVYIAPVMVEFLLCNVGTASEKGRHAVNRCFRH